MLFMVKTCKSSHSATLRNTTFTVSEFSRASEGLYGVLSSELFSHAISVFHGSFPGEICAVKVQVFKVYRVAWHTNLCELPKL